VIPPVTPVAAVTEQESRSTTPEARPSYWRVVRDQRKTIVVAAVLAIAAYWVLGQLGEWTLAGCIACGVGLGLLNHLATEYWLLRVITSGEQPTRTSWRCRRWSGCWCCRWSRWA